MTDSHQAELSKVLGFTPDDLEHNRRGYLSPAQLKRVRRLARVWVFLALLILFFPILCATLRGSFWLQPQFYARLFGMSLIIGAAEWGLRRYAKKLTGPVVQSATVNPAQADTGLNAVFTLDNGRKLYMSPLLYKRLLPSKMYRLYYTDYLPSADRRGPRLLSIEP